MCTREVTAYLCPDGGKPIFSASRGLKEGLRELKLPCGKCPECCRDYYTQWATRGSRELSLWESSLFITLTYDDEHLPAGGSLDKRDVQNFIKRVKRTFGSTESDPIRQIYCGEYGTQTNRPHYHAVLFNLDFFDKKPFRRTLQDHQVFTSETLTALWGKGHCEFGEATPASIAYIFKYILKKKSRKERKEPHIIQINGRATEVAHEFIEASRNPGIGGFLRDSNSIRKGYLSVDGVRTKLPKYYLEHLKKTQPAIAEAIQDARFDFQSNRLPETSLRKAQKEVAQKKLTDTKKRL